VSTKALSVYNALSRSRKDMTRAEALAYLRSTWTPALEEAYVAEGADHLVAAGFVMDIDGVLTAMTRDMHGVPRKLGRGPDGISLTWI
jgi:hypothetical protein